MDSSNRKLGGSTFLCSDLHTLDGYYRLSPFAFQDQDVDRWILRFVYRVLTFVQRIGQDE